MKIIFYTSIILLISSYANIYSLEMEINGTFSKYYNNNPGCIVNDDTPLKYMPFNLFDNNLNTAVAINITNKQPLDEVKGPYFHLQFKNNYSIDRIDIKNGFDINNILYNKNSRAKEIIISFLTNNIELFATNIVLQDISNVQSINFKIPILFNMISIYVYSSYPGTKYDDICLSKIEFWYKGEKYRVANVEDRVDSPVAGP